MRKTVNGLILCAGKGTRLMPYTESIPKPILLKTEGKSFLEISIENLLDLNVDHIFINYSYGLEHFEEVVKKFGSKISLIYEEEPLGHGRTILNLIEKVEKDSTLYCMNGDTIIEYDHSKFLQTHTKSDTGISILSNNDIPVLRNLIVDKQNNLVGCNINNRDYFYKKYSEELRYTNSLGHYLINMNYIDNLDIKGQDFVGLFGNQDLIEIMITNKTNVVCNEIDIQTYISVNTIEEYIKLIESNNGIRK